MFIRQYPFPFIIEISYTLKDAVLTMGISIKNTGDRNMPTGFGIHPYFSTNLSRNRGRIRSTDYRSRRQVLGVGRCTRTNR